jgi:hypothetical protein
MAASSGKRSDSVSGLGCVTGRHPVLGLVALRLEIEVVIESVVATLADCGEHDGHIHIPILAIFERDAHATLFFHDFRKSTLSLALLVDREWRPLEQLLVLLERRVQVVCALNRNRHQLAAFQGCSSSSQGCDLRASVFSGFYRIVTGATKSMTLNEDCVREIEKDTCFKRALDSSPWAPPHGLVMLSRKVRSSKTRYGCARERKDSNWKE